jgi:hypothetical protein
VATGTTSFITVQANNTVNNGSVFADNISAKELAGNHATQATAGSRPLYALLPANGVRNLANGSASVGDVNFWSASQVISGITAARVASGIDVDGLPYFDVRMTGTATGTSRDIAYLNGASRQAASVGQSFTASVTAQLIAGSATGISGVQVASVEETAPSTFVNLAGSALTVSTSETLLSATRTIATGNQARCAVVLVMNNGATIDATFRIKALQFELGSTRTAYQFNYSNVNIAQPPFAQVGALLFDGVDDFLQTPSVDFAGYEQLGSELVTNGDFAGGATGWSSTSWVISGGVATITNALDSLVQNVTFTAGRTYSVTYTLSGFSGTGAFRPRFFGGTTVTGTSVSANGTYTEYLTAVSGNNQLAIANTTATCTGTVDNISVREVLRPADKMTVFAGVRKLSDAAIGVVLESSVNSNSNNGAVWLLAPGSPGTSMYSFRSKGTSAADTNVTGYVAPITNVVTGLGDISGDISTVRVNGAQVGQSSTDQGTGNYGNYPLFIGRRGGTSLPFNGYLYSLIVRGAATPANLITATETWVNSRTGAY